MTAPSTWDSAFALAPKRVRPRLAGDKMYKFADVMAEDGDGFYRKLTSHW